MTDTNDREAFRSKAREVFCWVAGLGGFEDAVDDLYEFSHSQKAQREAWQPIETAPTDSEVCLLHVDGSIFDRVKYTEYGHWWWFLGGGKIYYPNLDEHPWRILKVHNFTHWCPRPLASSPAPAAVPEGYALAPIEPTDEMISAGADASKAFRVDILRSYEAMLAAAPSPAEPDHIAGVNKKVEEESEENHG